MTSMVKIMLLNKKHKKGKDKNDHKQLSQMVEEWVVIFPKMLNILKYI